MPFGARRKFVAGCQGSGTVQKKRYSSPAGQWETESEAGTRASFRCAGRTGRSGVAAFGLQKHIRMKQNLETLSFGLKTRKSDTTRLKTEVT